MHGVLHHDDGPMLGVVCSSHTQKQFIQQHLLATPAVLKGNIRSGGKVLSWPIRLSTSLTGIIAILTYAIYVLLCSAMEGQKCLPLVLWHGQCFGLEPCIQRASILLGLVILLQLHHLQVWELVQECVHLAAGGEQLALPLLGMVLAAVVVDPCALLPPGSGAAFQLTTIIIAGRRS